LFSWITQAVNGQDSADVLLAAMPQEVVDLAVEWLDANQEFFAQPDPVAIDEPFSETYASFANLPSNALLLEGDNTYRRAQCAFFEAREAGVRGGRLGLATVFLAIALVVGGIAALMNGKAAQIIVIAIASLSLVAGVAQFGLAGDRDEARAVAAANFFVNEDGSDIVVDDLGVPVDVPGALAIVDDVCPEIAR
jgi:hypothetical protein